MIRLFMLAFLVFTGPLAWERSAVAQPEVEVTLSASPREVRVGETLRLEVRAKARGGRLQEVKLADLGKYPELVIVSHQATRPVQFSFGFGSGVKVESSLSHVYVMRASGAGTFEFGPATAKVDGEIYRSEPLTIVVHAGAGGTATEPPPSDPTGAEVDSELSGARFDSRAFVRTVVEPKEVYIGQQVDVTVYLYTRLHLSGQTLVPSKPSMNGFWVHDDRITSLEGQEVAVRGARFRAYVIQRSAAFPQRSGKLTIGAPKVTFDSGGRSLFDAAERVERTGVPVIVDVKPLPQPGPANVFVGRYALRASLDRTAVKTGDAVTLRVEATGQGNVQDLRIDLPPIPGVRALQPTIRDTQRFDRKALVGTRSWEWILIAETPGQHVVPPIELHYFDPEAEEYGSAVTPTMTFSSTGPISPSQPALSPAQPPVKTDVVFGPIRMYSSLTRGTTPVRERGWFAWALGLPPALFILLALGAGLVRRRERRRATTGAVQRELLRNAQDALRRDDPRSFYDRVVASITHALDSRLKEPIGGLPHSELRARLAARGFDDDLVQRIINELEGADFARFAASGVNREEMERCLRRTVAIVERVQRSPETV